MTLDLATDSRIWYHRELGTREKVAKLDFIKMKNLYASKETIKKMKRIHNMGENICKSYFW